MTFKSYAINKGTIGYLLGILDAHIINGIAPTVEESEEIKNLLKKDIGEKDIKYIANI